jgi:hypothetical protein
MNKKVYVIMESVGDQSKMRVVYTDKQRAKSWIAGACFVEDKDASNFTIEEIDGVGF